MERFEVGRDGMLAAMIDAVERGEPVEIVRDGRTVAEVVRRAPEGSPDDAFWKDFWRRLKVIQDLVPPTARGGSGLVEQMREEGY